MNCSLRRCVVVASLAVIATSCGDPETVADGAASPAATTTVTTITPTTTTTTATTITTTASTTTETSSGSGSGSDEAGLGEPVWADGDFTITSVRALTGAVRQDDNGCWLAELGTERVQLALPPGFEAPDGESQRLVGPEGFEIVDGTAIDGMGQVVWMTDVAGGADSRWANLVAFCAPTTGAIAAFTSVAPGFDPSELDDAGLVAMLEGASLTESWGCGFGFALSTPDQRVGVFMYTDAAPASDETIVLPDARWSATVMVGKDLFANHCDDVIEFHEPETIIAATWTLTAGSFELSASRPEGLCGDKMVTSRLVGAVVSTPHGDIPLGVLDLRNDAWGCFAG